MGIKEEREAAGLSRQNVVDIMGIPYRTLQNYEIGERKAPKWLEKLIIEKIREIGNGDGEK